MSLRSVRDAAFGLGLMLGMSSGASAANIPFTWNPNLATPSLGGGAFTADYVVTSDYATAIINNFTGAFTETGILPFTQFSLANTNFTPTGFGSAYTFYITFNAAGQQFGPIPTISNQVVGGSIDSLTYTLWGTPSGSLTINKDSSNIYQITAGATNAIALATGSLVGTGGVSIQDTTGGLSPSANALVSMAAVTSPTNQAPFFVSPTYLNLNYVDTNFSSRTLVVSSAADPGNPTSCSISPNTSLCYTDLMIGGGSGNLSMTVPEPGSLAVFATGLFLLGGLGVRRRMRG